MRPVARISIAPPGHFANPFRTLCFLVALVWLLAACSADVVPSVPTVPIPTLPPTPATTAPSHLASFPRPPHDNGWGVHWAPTLFAQPAEVVDYFVGEAQSLGIKWVKFLNGDSDKLDQEYLVRSLVSHGMMPVMRVYQPFNQSYVHLDALVRTASPLGVHYYELYNEPNTAGSAGGWQPGEDISNSVGRIVDLWIPAAETIIKAGGYPGLPSLSPGGDVDDLQFLWHMLDLIKLRGRTDLLQRAWLPLHNYFLNHPVDYPNDDVNLHSTPLSGVEIARRRLTQAQVDAINHARQIARLPRAQGGYYVADNINVDSNAFRKFEAYHGIVVSSLGFEMPIISTEGGAVAGAGEDPRYPVLTDDDVSAETLFAYRYMIEQAPAYYFAFTPWLLANAAGGHSDPRFESAAWYKDRSGTSLPVVTVLKQSPFLGEVRRNSP